MIFSIPYERFCPLIMIITFELRHIYLSTIKKQKMKICVALILHLPQNNMQNTLSTIQLILIIHLSCACKHSAGVFGQCNFSEISHEAINSFMCVYMFFYTLDCGSECMHVCLTVKHCAMCVNRSA